MAARSRVPVVGTLGPLYLFRKIVAIKLYLLLNQSQKADLKKEGPPEIDPLALRERRQQTTMIAAASKIKKIPTAKTTIMTTKKINCFSLIINGICKFT